ncbi:uncharacterized protein DDB_G0290301 isoform X3 [Vigna radiata var. radiata]|uniref:Uncharacterized protein DDB_G0290301 isoform X3 n=1 Tax=Vigna radiata var. radiata TaxID=3916 RepID=A0A1S3VJ91_VIGRR|nr:uncharacterized protein DDB_G0290301 isoform X3 [Vigna radiata var. radiata]
MSLPDSPVPDDIETDPSEEEEEVEEETEEEEAEEVEEEEIEEEVEEEDFEEEVEEEEVEEVDEEEVDGEEVEEVDEEEVDEEEVEEVEEEEEVEEMELEEEEDEEGDGEQEVEEVEVEEEETEGEEEEVEVEVEEEEEGEHEVEEGEGEVQEDEGEQEKQEQEALEDNKEDQQQKQREAVEEKKEEQPQQLEETAEEKKEEQRQQQEEAVEEKKKEQEQQQEKAMEEKKNEQHLQQEAMKEKEGQQKEETVGEDRLAVKGSPPDADKGRQDLSLHMESKEQDKNLGPNYSVVENPEVIPPSSVHCIEETDAMLKISVPSREILTLKKEELHLKYDISSHSKSRENLTNVENCRSQGLEVDVENAGSLLQKEIQGGYSELGSNSKPNLCDDNDIDSRGRATKSSSDTGQDMVICLLPKNCIVEDASGGQNSRNNIKQLEREESRDDMKQTLSRTRSMSPSAEIKITNKRPKIICDFFAKGWCIRGSSCSFLHIKDTVDKTDQEAEADLVTAHQKRKLKVEEGVRDNVQRMRMNEQEQTPSWHPSQEKQNFTPRDNLFPENRFAFSSTSNYFNPNQDGMTTLRNQHIYKGYASTLLNHSPNSSLVTQFPSSRREDFRLVSSSSVPSYPTGYKSKICSYDWEPSVPFRPSFFITPMNVSSPGDLYDPLRDSIEIPNIGDGSLKASLLIQGSNVLASSQAPIYGDSAVIGKYTSSVNDDKSSVSSHNKLYENEPNKNSVPHEKNTETEITSGTYVNYQNGKIGTGQNTLGVADSTIKEREMTEHDARRHGEGSGHKTKRGDRDKKNHEIDVDFQMDGSMQKEPKALKMLRAALVDHVKELLKPVWHEGRLSKDAHIMIVRKSVDKVVSTIEPHQIPTIDTAKQYVSSSRAKIAKLVNGYVNKYGKS